MNQRELDNILKLHVEWLKGNPNGVRADLSGANLSEADLYGANLRGAYLRRANLYRANLCEANLCGADLFEANLCRANLCRAILCEADLCRADLCEATLYGANLREADLRRANLYKTRGIPPIVCPEKGEFIGFKKAYDTRDGGDVIVELLIRKTAKRSSATTRKCRCSKAKVLSITTLGGIPMKEAVALSGYDHKFTYTVGQTVEVKDFDPDRWNECAPGIHFFITRQEAVEY